MRKANMTRRANISVLLTLIFLTLLEVTAKGYLKQSSYRYIIISLIDIAVFIIPAVILTKSQDKKPKSFLRLKRFKLKWIPLIITTTFTASLGGILINMLVSLMPISPVSSEELTQNLLSSSPETMLSSFFAIVLVPAVVEEIYFRGAVLSSFELKNLKSAVIASSVLFGVLHSSPTNFFGPFLAGLCFALLTLVFNSIYPAMLAHFINNAFSSILIYYSNVFVNIGLGIYMIAFVFILFLIMLYMSLWLVESFLVKKSTYGEEEESKLKKRLVKYNHSPIFGKEFFIIILFWLIKIFLEMKGII